MRGNFTEFIRGFCKAVILLLWLGFTGSLCNAQNFSENAEIYVYESSASYGITLKEYSCLKTSDSQTGCYYVVLQLPEGLEVYYSEETRRRIPESQRNLYDIKEGEDGIVSVLIPDFGGSIDFVHSGKNIIMGSHRFPSMEEEDVFFYSVRVREQGTPLYWDDEESAEGEITWVTDFDETEGEPSTEVHSSATQNGGDDSGMLLVNSDVEADVVINGATYSVNRSISLPVGVQEITISHELGSKTERVEIRKNERTIHTEYFKPERTDVLLSGVIIPGSGHIGTDRNRGWAYLLGTLGAVGLSFDRNNRFSDVTDNLEEALELYNRAGSIEAAQFARAEVELLVAEQKDINRQRNMALIGSVLIYSASLIDLFTTEPKYGYRNGSLSVGDRFSLSPAPVYIESGIHASVNFSISW